MPILFDTNMVVRDSDDGALSADFLSAAFDFGRMVKPVWLAVYVPAGGAAMTLDISIQIDSGGGSYVDYVKYPQISEAPDDPIYIPFLLPSGYQDASVKVNMDVGGTSPNFGTVVAGWVLKPHYNL